MLSLLLAVPCPLPSAWIGIVYSVHREKKDEERGHECAVICTVAGGSGGFSYKITFIKYGPLKFISSTLLNVY
jgi:hypothetical protein